MKTRLALVILLLGSVSARPQIATPSFESLISEFDAWAQENIDTNVLQQLPQIDRAQAREFVRDLQRELQGEYIINLAALRDIAELALPLLDQYEETHDFAIWLRSRMDYLRIANKLTVVVPPPTTTNSVATIRTNPPASIQREVWIEEIKTRPWPPAASNYVTRLKPVFTAAKVPAALVWIAEVESSFDPRARSPVGAAGLFQLMPETAKRFGLSLWPRDQRFQPVPSATASAKYLKYLHNRFKDWRLALAAYNCGEGRVSRLLQKHKATTFDEIAPHLPAETQMYVPKIEATLLRREGTTFAKLSATHD